MHETLKAIRSRPRALIQFTYRMEDESLDSAQREDEMNMARAHCRDIIEETHRFLRVAQPGWQKLSRVQRHEAVKRSFAKARALRKQLHSSAIDVNGSRTVQDGGVSEIQ